MKLQSIDVDVVADRLADLVEAGPTGRAADLGGPEVLPLGQMLTAAVLLFTAVWMAVSPATFHGTVAPFGELNDHLFRDVATFTLPLVIGLWIAADRRSWRVPVFIIVMIQNGTHALNHLVDLTATDPVWIGVGTFISLIATQALLAFMLVRTLRPESTRTGTGTAQLVGT